MTTLLFSVALIVLAVAVLGIAMTVEHLSKEMDELKEKLEFHRIKLQYVESCELDNENRLDRLEKALELKEYFDEEPLNEEKNEQNI